MDQETFNLSIRKFLKMVGINSQREIEQAVASALASGSIKGAEAFPAKVTLVVAGQFGMVLLVGPPLGIQPAFMVEATPPAARCTTIALGFNTTFGIVGGLTPLVATWLVHRTADDLSPAFMIMGAAVISFASVLTFKEAPRPLAAAAPP